MEKDTEVELVPWCGGTIADFAEDHAVRAVDANGAGRGHRTWAQKTHAVGRDVEHLPFDVDRRVAEDAKRESGCKRDSVFFSAFHEGLIGSEQ
jgi:hypothetical protein